MPATYTGMSSSRQYSKPDYSASTSSYDVLGGPNGMSYFESQKREDIYDGEWQGECRHGHGRMLYKSKDLYDGQWKESKRSGSGQIDYQNGDSYSGYWEDDVKQGHGMCWEFRGPDQSVWELKDGATKKIREPEALSDQDLFVKSGGNMDDGAALANFLSALATWRDQGSRPSAVDVAQFSSQGREKQLLAVDGVHRLPMEDGSVVSARPDGVMTFSNYETYSGEWKGDLQDGLGVAEYRDTKEARYVGGWKEGKRHGMGSLTYTNGNVYIGNFSFGTRDDTDGVSHHMRYHNGDTYDGEWKDEMREGHGVYTFANGDIYEGGFHAYTEKFGTCADGSDKVLVRDYMDGRGKLTFKKTGDVFEGTWKKDFRQDTGILEDDVKDHYTFKNGDNYSGCFVRGRKHGAGTMVYADKSWYKGMWFDDLREGKGRWELANGNIYDGQWKAGFMHGCGDWEDDEIAFEATSWPDTNPDSKIAGNFMDGVKHGKGRMAYHKKNCTFKGVWLRGDRSDGYGQMEYYATEDGDSKLDRVYTGTWKNEAEDGQGRMKYHNGQQDEQDGGLGEYDEYEGIFVNGKRSGLGRLTYTNKDEYVGQFDNDQPNGHGTISYANKDVYVGNMSEGRRFGKGKMTYANGYVFFDIVGLNCTATTFVGEWDGERSNGFGELTADLRSNEGTMFYQGEFEDQKRYGRGIMTISYFDKKKPVDKYSGEWVDDKCHGRGTKLFSCLDCFEGMFENGIRADGQGVMTFKDGRIYSGNWKAFTTVGMNDDVEHDGQGTMTFPTGDEYTGQWLHSMQDGEGTMNYCNGDVFEGTFTDGHKCEGRQTYAILGTSYNGQWAGESGADNDVAAGTASMEDGQGEFTYSNGDTFTGTFKDGKRCDGQGKMSYGDFVHYRGIYEGEFVDERRSGAGKFMFSDGGVYEGDWVKGKEEGAGQLVFSSNSPSLSYKGAWKYGMRDGVGVYRTKGGDVYEGDWKGDVMDGTGSLTYANGDVYKGTWSKDIRALGEGRMTYADQSNYSGQWHPRTGDVMEGRKHTLDHSAMRHEEQWHRGPAVQDGHGRMVFGNGETYDGDWMCGQRHGEGTHTYANGDKFTGPWLDGVRRDGFGTIKYGKGDLRQVYKGYFLAEKAHGEGCVVYKAGVSYKGQFSAGTENGAGQALYKLVDNPDGSQRNEKKYRGQWLDGSCSGKGEMEYWSGSKYTGDWVNYQRNGRGTFSYFTGELYTGGWKDGQRQDGSGNMQWHHNDLKDSPIMEAKVLASSKPTEVAVFLQEGASLSVVKDKGNIYLRYMAKDYDVDFINVIGDLDGLRSGEQIKGNLRIKLGDPADIGIGSTVKLEHDEGQLTDDDEWTEFATFVNPMVEDPMVGPAYSQH